MRIAYDNMADQNTIVSASEAKVGYPASNVQNDWLTSKYITTTANSVVVTFDVGARTEIDDYVCVALNGHNFSSVVSVIVDINTINFFPGFSQETIAYNEGMMLKFFSIDLDIGNYYLTTEAGEYLMTEDGFNLIMESDPSHTYVQFQITDASLDKLEIGRLWFGNYISIIPSSLLNFKVTKRRSDIVIHGRNRQKWAVKGVGHREFSLTFPPTNTDGIDQIITMFNTVGRHKSIIFCNFDAVRDYTLIEPCACSIYEDTVFTASERLLIIYSLILQENI